MRVLIAGGGTMGRELASALPEHEVSIIELNPDKAKKIREDYKNVNVIEGNATKIYILKKAEYEKADVILAVTHNDETNLFIALLAKSKGKKAFARIKEPDYMPLFTALGIENIICPEKRAAMDIAKKIVWE